MQVIEGNGSKLGLLFNTNHNLQSSDLAARRKGAIGDAEDVVTTQVENSQVRHALQG